MKAPAAILLVSCSLLGTLAAAPARAACPPYVKTTTGGDYTDAVDRENLQVVEQFHFTPQVERLVSGQSGHLGDDIAYTLEHFPNHHRALSAMAKLALRDKTAQPVGAHYTVDCYFDRALRFKPADAKVRSILGGYLLAQGQADAALAQLKEAARLEPDNATTHYNLGLLYMKKKQYADARQAAHRAYELGFPLPGLKNQLAAARQWDEPR